MDGMVFEQFPKKLNLFCLF